MGEIVLKRDKVEDRARGHAVRMAEIWTAAGVSLEEDQLMAISTPPRPSRFSPPDWHEQLGMGLSGKQFWIWRTIAPKNDTNSSMFHDAISDHEVVVERWRLSCRGRLLEHHCFRREGRPSVPVTDQLAVREVLDKIEDGFHARIGNRYSGRITIRRSTSRDGKEG